VDLGGAVVESTYGGILRATDNFFEAPRGGGIMGLSFGDYALCDQEFSCFPPLLDDVVKQTGVQDRFAICANGNDSVLVLGGGSESLRSGPIEFVPLLPPFAFYIVGVADVSLSGGVSLLNRRFIRGPTAKLTAIVDTGNSALFLPEVRDILI
jgi:hypothetical protein